MTTRQIGCPGRAACQGLCKSTLDDLDPPAWDLQPPYPSSLVARCHELRRMPIAELDVEALRMLIGQQSHCRCWCRERWPSWMSTRSRGHHYPGDPRQSVLDRVDQEYRLLSPSRSDLKRLC
jgi:hypothetical protein